ncbi:succinylglutamate desuccinylase/aspartoacylase family protein [Enterovibrio sp. ZSDZ42]|uniref:Succinylglutamate desuccinylase/aspartoacylase family protein n=1 Tax=Enterovibrio gelatinilyticus TaxID=2899819 RepID=A0ABT5R5C3_9GAMM|nr:succinylglutamate desuccinylase/aspartoacylase family protein [Enterovibrio sp. ZSDZ42]MDD1794682.1 succinylglutamate desuccinylase/aspartoacylase family protein [Enterovibrio sp. ZSDZ42]
MATRSMTTIIEGNQIDGLAVISALDVTTLEAGQHKFWFRAATNALAQSQHLPVWVFKGQKAGKKIVITAGVHGDEYNGVLTAQAIARSLQDQDIAGCITIIPTVNLTGMLNHSRDFFSADPDVSCGNLNRHFPGNANGNEPQRYLYTIWHKLLMPNAELAIDLHTQTSGTAYPLYAFADYRLDDALQMARLMNPDAILDDPGDPGILETVWNQNHIPSITVEIGVGRYTDTAMIARTVTGAMNIFKHYDVIDGMPEPIEKAIESARVTTLKAVQGGFILPQVSLLQHVETDQLLAIQYDSFGEEVHHYRAPESAVVLSINVESMRAAGSMTIRLIHPE